MGWLLFVTMLIASAYFGLASIKKASRALRCLVEPASLPMPSSLNALARSGFAGRILSFLVRWVESFALALASFVASAGAGAIRWGSAGWSNGDLSLTFAAPATARTLDWAAMPSLLHAPAIAWARMGSDPVSLYATTPLFFCTLMGVGAVAGVIRSLSYRKRQVELRKLAVAREANQTPFFGTLR